MKKLIIFDLDGTLAKSKSPIDLETGQLLKRLLKIVQVAIISGGDWPQFQIQVLNHLPKKLSLEKLTILPTCGTKFYQYRQLWEQVYAENFTTDERFQILENLKTAIKSAHLNINKIWGEQIEDRGSQITFSALGQRAPLLIKKDWDPHFEKRKKIKEILDAKLSGFSVSMGGSTSIDITRPGIDKAYGIYKLNKLLDIEISEMLFIGDALFDGGNDHAVKKTGVDCIQVRDPEETKNIIRTIIACSEDFSNVKNEILSRNVKPVIKSIRI